MFPLTELLKTRAKFVWSPECQQAFDKVKTVLCSSPILAAPRFDRTFFFQVDASQVGAGAVFLQGYDLDIRHIKGVDNVIADALSHAPLP